jgi:hypothetical protein
MLTALEEGRRESGRAGGVIITPKLIAEAVPAKDPNLGR